MSEGLTIFVGNERERIELPMEPDKLVKLVNDRKVMGGECNYYGYEHEIREGDDAEEINVFAMALEDASLLERKAMLAYENERYNLDYMQVANLLRQGLAITADDPASWGKQIAPEELMEVLDDYRVERYFDFAKYGERDDTVVFFDVGMLMLGDDLPADNMYDLHELADEYGYPYAEDYDY